MPVYEAVITIVLESKVKKENQLTKNIQETNEDLYLCKIYNRSHL